MYLWDQEQQKVVKVDDGTVQESIASGKYLPFKGKMHVWPRTALLAPSTRRTLCTRSRTGTRLKPPRCRRTAS